MTKEKRAFVKLCVAALGKAVGSTSKKGLDYGLELDEIRSIWKEILIMTANGGGKMK